MRWWEYVEQTAHTDRQRDISDRTGIDATNVSRWKTGQVPRPAIVAEFARAYQRPVLEAFVAAGFLTPEEAAEQPSAPPSLDSLTDDELVDAIRRRLHERGAAGGDTAPTTTRDVSDLSERRPRVPERRVARRPDNS